MVMVRIHEIYLRAGGRSKNPGWRASCNVLNIICPLGGNRIDSFIHSQRKRNLKILTKFFKNQKSIKVAPGKNLKNQ